MGRSAVAATQPHSSGAATAATAESAPILNANAPMAWWKQGLVPMGGAGTASLPAGDASLLALPGAVGGTGLGLGASTGAASADLLAPAAGAASISDWNSTSAGHAGAATTSSNGALGLPMAVGHLGALPLLPPSSSTNGGGQLTAYTPRSRLFSVFGRPAAVASTGSASDAGLVDHVHPPSTLAGGGDALHRAVQPDTPGSVSSITAFPPLSHRVGGVDGAARGGGSTGPVKFGLSSSPRDALWHPNMRSQIVRNNPYGRSVRPLFQYAACSRPGGARGGDAEANEDKYTAVADALRVGARVASWTQCSQLTTHDSTPVQMHAQGPEQEGATTAAAAAAAAATTTSAAGQSSGQTHENTSTGEDSIGALPCSSLFGVMDGHGGGQAAVLVADGLFEVMAQKWGSAQNMTGDMSDTAWQVLAEEAFNGAFSSLQQRLQKLTASKGGTWGQHAHKGLGGHSAASGSQFSGETTMKGPLSGLDGSTVVAALVLKLPPLHPPAVDSIPPKGSAPEAHPNGLTPPSSVFSGGGRFGVTIGHVGDSAALLVCADGSFALLTPPHATWRADEQARLRAANCATHDGRVGGVLDMTRSCGDCAFGEAVSCFPDLVHFEFETPPTQTPEGESSAPNPPPHKNPVRCVVRPPSQPVFLVLASDGVWDCVPPYNLAQIMMGMSPSEVKTQSDGGVSTPWTPPSLNSAFADAPACHWAKHHHGRVAVPGGGVVPVTGVAGEPAVPPSTLHVRVLSERCVAEALCRGARDDVTALVVDLRHVQES